MYRVSRPKKVEEWTSRLARFADSGQTIAQFCQDEGVSPPSFYQWKKKLAKSSSGFQPVHHASLPNVCGDKTIVRLGHGIEIELGNDLSIVECVLQQLLAASAETASTARGPSC